MEDKIQTGIPWRKNTIVFSVITFVLYSGYQLSNRFHLKESYLPLTPLDSAIPFLIWTVWPYFILIFLTFLPYGIKDRALFGKTMLAFIIAVTLNILFWIFLPTIFMRPALPADTGITTFAYRWLCSIDTPANCFPSGHITSPTIGCWAFSKQYPKYRIWIWLSFLLLSISIFTTKQHYFWDLPGGLLTAAFGIWLGSKIYCKINASKKG